MLAAASRSRLPELEHLQNEGNDCETPTNMTTNLVFAAGREFLTVGTPIQLDLCQCDREANRLPQTLHPNGQEARAFVFWFAFPTP